MINKIDILDKCSFLRKLNNSVFFDRENICYVDNIKSLIPKDIILYSYRDDIYYYKKKKLYKINSVDNVEVVFDYDNSTYINPVKDYFLVYNRISRQEKIFKLVNLKKETLWEETEKVGFKVFKDFLLKFQDASISSINLMTGKSFWQFDFLHESKIYGEIHTHKSILVVPQEDEQDKITMVGLDITSGKILWQTKTSLAYYKKKENKLYGFASTVFGDNFYSEINIETGELFEKSFTDYKKSVVSHLATIHNNYLYYSVYKNSCEIGIIDLQSKDIIHEYPLNLEQGVQIGAPVVTDDKIYILDSNNALHIYKK